MCSVFILKVNLRNVYFCYLYSFFLNLIFYLTFLCSSLGKIISCYIIFQFNFSNNQRDKVFKFKFVRNDKSSFCLLILIIHKYYLYVKSKYIFYFNCLHFQIRHTLDETTPPQSGSRNFHQIARRRERKKGQLCS